MAFCRRRGVIAAYSLCTPSAQCCRTPAHYREADIVLSIYHVSSRCLYGRLYYPLRDTTSAVAARYYLLITVREEREMYRRWATCHSWYILWDGAAYAWRNNSAYLVFFNGLLAVPYMARIFVGIGIVVIAASEGPRRRRIAGDMRSCGRAAYCRASDATRLCVYLLRCRQQWRRLSSARAADRSTTILERYGNIVGRPSCCWHDNYCVTQV